LTLLKTIDDVDIADMSDVALREALIVADADLVAVSLGTGKPFIDGGVVTPLYETENYRRVRVKQIAQKRKALLNEMRRRKLQVD
jgi:hypothetical protein